MTQKVNVAVLVEINDEGQQKLLQFEGQKEYPIVPRVGDSVFLAGRDQMELEVKEVLVDHEVTLFFECRDESDPGINDTYHNVESFYYEWLCDKGGLVPIEPTTRS